MSRGFDGFDIDDFRDPQWESEGYGAGRESSRGRGSGSQSGGTGKSKLEKLRKAESIGDQVAAQSREHPVAGRSPLPRDTKQAALLAERDRTNYRERDRGYSLRQSEIHALTEVAKFRVVAVEDLAKFAYSSDRSWMENVTPERSARRPPIAISSTSFRCFSFLIRPPPPLWLHSALWIPDC